MSIALIVGIVGIFVGSFLNVVNFRFGQWKSIVLTRSHCPKCKHVLGFWDLVPILSFLVLGGKCRYCKTKISWQYPAVEIISGFVAIIIWTKLMPQNNFEYIHAVSTIIFTYIMLLISIEDVKEMAVSDQLFIAGFIIALISVLSAKVDITSIVLGVLFASLPLLVLVAGSRERWMGWGDVFIAVSVGMILGFPASLIWLLGSFWIGAIAGLLLMAMKLKTRKDPVPFVPILMISFLLAFYWGGDIVQWYLAKW